MTEYALDGHVHCGISLPFEQIRRQWDEGNINGGSAFSPVEEIYDRYDPSFTDSPKYRESREQVHDYLLGLSRNHTVFPYFFIWNDFAPIPEDFVGIKWHRHASEPTYDYHTDACERCIEEICRRKLPVVLEEEFENTLNFVKRINGRTVVIVPHLGALNGGYYRIKSSGLYADPMVWADTALASEREIADYTDNFGTERLIFGSDFPFGRPVSEKRKVTNVLTGEDRAAVLAGNLLRLLGKERD